MCDAVTMNECIKSALHMEIQDRVSMHESMIFRALKKNPGR